jgi:transposase
MKKSLRFVGLDVHKDSVVMAVAGEGVVAVLPNDRVAVIKALGRVGPAKALRVCYEAGPTGYGLARYLNRQGIACSVVAPSLIPMRRGCRIKTDRRDAVALAQFLRSGELVEVAIPSPETEALRDLERAREDAVCGERAARQQLDKFLLRHERTWTQGRKWTLRHWKWIREQEFGDPVLQRVHEDYWNAAEAAARRIVALTSQIEELAGQTSLGPMVTALQALRGVRLVTAVTVAAEIGDFCRFAQPRQLMAYVGLVPSEYSSGGRRRQGAITRTGNKHVRWILTEAAWQYQYSPRASKPIARRRKAVSAEVRQIAERAEERLHRRFRQLLNKNKTKNKVATAIARELLGFIWAIARVEKKLAA